MDNARCLPPSLLWPKPEATSTKASYNFTRHWAEAGSCRENREFREQSRLVPSRIPRSVVQESFQIFAGGGDDKFSMFHPAQTEDLIGDLPEFGTSSFHDHYLQTVVVIQVDVGGGQYLRVGLVLNLGQAIAQVWTMVVVNHGESGGDDFVLVTFFGYQMLANQIAHRLGAVLVAPLDDRLIEFLQQISLQRKPGPYQICHDGSLHTE